MTRTGSASLSHPRKGLRVMSGRLRSRSSVAGQSLIGWLEHRTGLVRAVEKFLREPALKRGRGSPLALLHGIILARRHLVFGSEMEYRNRLAKLLLYTLPWLDRQPGHAAIRRPFTTVVGILVVVV